MRSELRTQCAGLRGVTGTMSAIAGNTRFRKKRLQDDQVVSGVVATCILSTLWYLFA